MPRVKHYRDNIKYVTICAMITPQAKSSLQNEAVEYGFCPRVGGRGIINYFTAISELTYTMTQTPYTPSSRTLWEIELEIEAFHNFLRIADTFNLRKTKEKATVSMVLDYIGQGVLFSPDIPLTPLKRIEKHFIQKPSTTPTRRTLPENSSRLFLVSDEAYTFLLEKLGADMHSLSPGRGLKDFLWELVNINTPEDFKDERPENLKHASLAAVRAGHRPIWADISTGSGRYYVKGNRRRHRRINLSKETLNKLYDVAIYHKILPNRGSSKVAFVSMVLEAIGMQYLVPKIWP